MPSGCAILRLNADDVVGFEQPGTTGRVDIVLRQNTRVTFLDTKEMNWYAIEKAMKEGVAAQSRIEQIMGHVENQNVFARVVIRATGRIPDWFINLFEEEGIAVEVFYP